jgi:hypothetical protein
LRGRDVAEADADELASVAQRLNLGELVLDRHALLSVGQQSGEEVHTSQEHRIDAVSAERA